MACLGNAGDGGWDRGDDQGDDGDWGRKRYWGHYMKLYDARDKRKKILRTQVGELRARLNRQLHAEAKALRRAAREELREEVRRLDDEEMARRQSGGINRVHGGGVREFGDQRGTSSSEDHHDRVDPRLAREDINRRPLVNIQADLTNRDPRRRNNPEDDIQFLREYHANTIRRVAAQQREMRQQQRTVEAVRELRQEMGRNGGEDQRRGASTSNHGGRQPQQHNAGHANHQLHAVHAGHQLHAGHADHQPHAGHVNHQPQAGTSAQHQQQHQGQVQPNQEVICDLAVVRSFTLVLEREDTTIWQVYTTHPEIVALFINRGLSPMNNFWGVHSQELYGILAATDVGYNGNSMTIMTASIVWSADGGELWDRDAD